MRTQAWIFVPIAAALAVAGCGTELDFGGDRSAPGGGVNPPGTNAPDAGAADGSSVPGLTGDASAPPMLTPCPSGRLCWADPMPTGDHFSGIWASADDDVWMVTVSGTVVHWDGAKLETKYQATNASTARIWGFGPNDVWILLNRPSGTPQQIHWDGASFTDRTGMNEFCSRNVAAIAPATFVNGPVAVVFREDGYVSFYSPAHGEILFHQPVPLDGHAAVDVFAASDTGGTRLVVWALRDDGHLFKMSATGIADPWQEEPFDPPPAGYISGLGAGLGGTSTSDAWAFYEVTQPDGYVTTVFRHFDGTAWTTAQRETLWAYGGIASDVVPAVGRRMWVAGPSDIWASGSTVRLWHWDGQRWSVAPSTENAASGTTDSAYHLLYGAAASVWAIGEYGRIFRRSGGTWTKLAGGHQYDRIAAISARQDDDVWALRAEIATELRPSGMSVLHFDGATWQTVPVGSASWPRLYGNEQCSVVGFAANDAWITGRLYQQGQPYDPNLQLLHWDGAWKVIDEVPNASALWGSGPADVWASSIPADPNSTGPWETRRWDGHTWTKLPIDKPVVSISGTGPDDVWLSLRTFTTGDLGGLLHWNGASFVTVALPSGLCAGRVLAAGSGEAWMFGGSVGGCTNHWDGSVWHSLSAPSQISAAWAASANDVWFTGVEGEHRASLVHWDGRNFGQDVAQPVGPSLGTASGSGPNDMWVAGAGGAILRTSFVAKPAIH